MSNTLISKNAFLTEKANNFRTWIQSFSPDAEAQLLMSSFSEHLLLPTILLHLVPLSKSGQLETTADQVLNKLTNVPEDEKVQVKEKLIRYFQMSVEVATS